MAETSATFDRQQSVKEYLDLCGQLIRVKYIVLAFGRASMLRDGNDEINAECQNAAALIEKILRRVKSGEFGVWRRPGWGVRPNV